MDTPLAESGIIGTRSEPPWSACVPCARCSSRTSSRAASTSSSTSPARCITARGSRCRSRPPAVRRRVLGRAVPLPEPRGVVHARARDQGRRSVDRRGRKGASHAAIRDPNPVCYMEHKHLYRRIKGEVPEGCSRRRSRPESLRKASDLVVIAYGAMVQVALEAAEDLDGASVEVLDLRSLVPLDEDAILDSVARCSKVVIVDEANATCAAGAQVAALIAERGFEDLDGPVVRVASPESRSHSRRHSNRRCCPAERVGRRAVSSSSTRTRSRSVAWPDEGDDLRPATRALPLVDVTMPQMGVSVAEGTVVAWRVERRGPDQCGRDDLRDLDRQDRHRGALARKRRRDRDPRARRDDGRGRRRARADRDRGSRRGAERYAAPPRLRHGNPEAPPTVAREPARSTNGAPAAVVTTAVTRPSSSASPPSTALTWTRCQARAAAVACASRTCSRSSSGSAAAVGRRRSTSRARTARTSPPRGRRVGFRESAARSAST